MARPRRLVPRHLWLTSLDPSVREYLSEQAAAVDLKLATYLELLLSRTHRYAGPYLPDAGPLPTVLPVDQIREQLAAMASLSRPVGSSNPHLVPVRGDLPLAEEIRQRCAELDCAYTEYLRTVFEMAAGTYDREPVEQLQMSLEEVMAS